MAESWSTIIILLLFLVTAVSVIFFLNIALHYYRHISKTAVVIMIILLGLTMGTGLAGLSLIREQPAARNAQRSNDVQVILDAVWTYAGDVGFTPDKLNFIPACPVNNNDPLADEIGILSGKVDLQHYLFPEYLTQIPEDPSGRSQGATGYTVCRNQDHRFEVAAPLAENGKMIVYKR
jgi:hypothetical protein